MLQILHYLALLKLKASNLPVPAVGESESDSQSGGGRQLWIKILKYRLFSESAGLYIQAEADEIKRNVT